MAVNFSFFSPFFFLKDNYIFDEASVRLKESKSTLKSRLLLKVAHVPAGPSSFIP